MRIRYAPLSIHVDSMVNVYGGFVSVTARHSGQPASLLAVTRSVGLSCPLGNVEVMCLGQLEARSVAYRVQVLDPALENIELPVVLKFVPRHSQQLPPDKPGTSYRLQHTLGGAASTLGLPPLRVASAPRETG